MAQNSYFFDSVAGDRIYSSLDFSRVFRRLAKNGITLGDGGELEVTANDPADMTVIILDGSAWTEGTLLWNTDPQGLAIASNASGNPRIDRVIVKMDRNTSAREMTLEIKQGTPALSPVPPSLQRDSTVWEISLAQVLVASGAAQVLQGDITDERYDPDVCGLSIHPALTKTDGEWVLLATHQDDNSGTPFDYTYNVPNEAMLFDEYRVTGYVINDSGSSQNFGCRYNGASSGYQMTYYDSGGIGTFTIGTTAYLVSALSAGSVAQFDLYVTGRHKYGSAFPRFRCRTANGSVSLDTGLDGHLAQNVDEMTSLRILFGTGGVNGRGVLKIWGRNIWTSTFPS